MNGKQALTLFTTAALGYFAMESIRNVAGARDGELTGTLIKIGGVALGIWGSRYVLKAAGVSA